MLLHLASALAIHATITNIAKERFWGEKISESTFGIERIPLYHEWS